MSRHWAATVVMIGQLGAAGLERQRRDVPSPQVKGAKCTPGHPHHSRVQGAMPLRTLTVAPGCALYN